MASSASSRRQSQSGSSKASPGSRVSRSQRKRVSMDIPERFKDEDDEEEDAAGDEEMLGPGYIQQSLYGLIRAAGQPKGEIGSHFQPDSSSDSDGNAETEGVSKQSKARSRPGSQGSSRQSSFNERQQAQRPESSKPRKAATSLRTLMKPIHERSDRHSEDPMAHSQFLPSREEMVGEPERPASATGVSRGTPAVDHEQRADKKADMASSTSTVVKKSRDGGTSKEPKGKKALTDVIANIFQLEEPEEVIMECPCWYLQNVLLQGYMYITEKHIYFFSYLPRKANTAIKSGYLGKQGKRNPRYRRYWFTLKGDFLSYFASAADPYFPSGTVDLRYGITADLAPEKGQGKAKDTTCFTVTTDSRVYHFRADSATSAKEWVKQLQKVIFRSHNDGDSVKISLPIANVVDVESNAVIEFADTIKLRVIANDETYAVDEYFFTFFNLGREALNLINTLMERNESRKIANREGRLGLESLDAAKMAFSLQSDASPGLSGDLEQLAMGARRSVLRPSTTRAGRSNSRSAEFHTSGGEHSRSSSDRGRRTSKSTPSPSADESTESFATSSAHLSNSPERAQIDMSASQMLMGDGAFRSPTLQPHRNASRSKEDRESQQESSIQSPTNRTARVQPLRSPSEMTMPVNGRRSTNFAERQRLRPPPTPTERMPMRVLATPLQRAFNLYDHMRSHGKRGLSYLGSSPKEYYNKFSVALAGGQRHYSEPDGLAPDDCIDDPEDDIDSAEHQRRFREHFALPESEKLLSVFYCWLHRVLPLYGKIYIGERYFCFRSLLYGTRTKLKVAFRNIVNVEKEKGLRWKFPGMVVVLRGREEIFFDFGSNGLRDDCVVTVLRGLDAVRMVEESVVLTEGEKMMAEAAATENELLQEARKGTHAGHYPQLPGAIGMTDSDSSPILFDDPGASMLDFKPSKPMRITCLTIGSRGDVQPYIALCRGLMADGHQTRIATHHEFGPWVEKYGIEFVPVEGDPADLMRICVENGMFTPSFIYEVNSKFRSWLDTLLDSAYEACKGSELLIESPPAMGGIHIAEALGIPYFRAFTMLWTRTRAYPHAFAVPDHKMGGNYNYMTYTMFDNLFWKMTARQINRWRRKTLGLGPTSLERLQPNKVPFLYNFSPSVVVPPLDFSAWIKITGYWFLDEGDEFTPPDDLIAFLHNAREDKAKLVYIGFGSVTVNDSKTLTQQVVDAVLKADVRCILSKGWSDRLDKNQKDPTEPEVVLPPQVFRIKSAPHDWLFRQVDAAVHHGGAGTTGASLRAGVPTLIRPFFGDQYFSATRVEDLGVGMHLRKLTANVLGRAIWIATHDERMRMKARMLGDQIRKEDGVGTAIKTIYRDLEYAKTLIKKRGKHAVNDDTEDVDDNDDDDAEESWTFVENDTDVDVTDIALQGGVTESNKQTGQHLKRESKILRGKTSLGTDD